MTNQSTVTVADRIRGIAAEKRVRQTDLADILHTSRMAIHRRMSGSVPFTADELELLGAAMAVNVGAFFGEPRVSPESEAKAGAAA